MMSLYWDVVYIIVGIMRVILCRMIKVYCFVYIIFIYRVVNGEIFFFCFDT